MGDSSGSLARQAIGFVHSNLETYLENTLSRLGNGKLEDL